MPTFPVAPVMTTRRRVFFPDDGPGTTVLVDPVNASYAASRIVVGVALAVAPGPVGGAWLGDAAGDAGTRAVLRGLGVRDIVRALHIAEDLASGLRSRGERGEHR